MNVDMDTCVLIRCKIARTPTLASSSSTVLTVNTKPTRVRPWQTISRLTGKILSLVLVTQPVFPSAAKPWICPICQHTSSTTSNLNNHIKKVHKVTLCQAEMMTKRSRYGRDMTEDEVEQNRVAVQVIFSKVWVVSLLTWASKNIVWKRGLTGLVLSSGELTEGKQIRMMGFLLLTGIMAKMAGLDTGKRWGVSIGVILCFWCTSGCR